MKNIKRSALWLSMAGMSLTMGCCFCGGEYYDDIPAGAIPEQPYVTVRRHFDLQSDKAEADDFVFYRHEFYMDGKELGPYGQYHLRLIANRLNETPFPVLIQAVPDPRLNEERRQTVVAALKRAGHDDADQRVIVGFPEAEGMSGDEAERVNASLPQAGTGVNGTGGLFRNNGYGGNSIFNSGNFGSGNRPGGFRGGFGLPFF